MILILTWNTILNIVKILVHILFTDHTNIKIVNILHCKLKTNKHNDTYFKGKHVKRKECMEKCIEYLLRSMFFIFVF